MNNFESPIFSKETYESAIKIVSNWDFTLTIKKLQEKKYAWSELRAITAVKNYKKYLAVTKALDGFQLVPNGDIDEIWHFHILDTKRYAEDSQMLFGGFLHHYPFYGMLDEANKEDWLENQGYSATLWSELFGEDLYKNSNDAPNCPQLCPCGKTNISAIDKKYFHYKDVA